MDTAAHQHAGDRLLLIGFLRVNRMEHVFHSAQKKPFGPQERLPA